MVLSKMGPRFWAWSCQHRPTWRESKTEAGVAFVVFGITGSATVGLVRPALKSAGLEGSLLEGPNSYRIASVVIVSPIYSIMLVALGTIAGRHRFFGTMSSKMLGRFFPFGGRILCPPARAAAARAAAV